MNKKQIMLALFCCLALVLVVASPQQGSSSILQSTEQHPVASKHESLSASSFGQHSFTYVKCNALHQDVYVLQSVTNSPLHRIDYDEASIPEASHITAQANTPYY